MTREGYRCANRVRAEDACAYHARRIAEQEAEAQ
jgi:hypothetical protein